MSAEVELRMLEGSEFQTVGAAMLKPRVKYARGLRCFAWKPGFIYTTTKYGPCFTDRTGPL